MQDITTLTSTLDMPRIANKEWRTVDTPNNPPTQTQPNYEDLVQVKTYKALVVQMGEHGPQFVSPIIIKNKTCQACLKPFGPLVYQVGHTAMTQHELTCPQAMIYSETSFGVSQSNYIIANATAYVSPTSYGSYTQGPYLRIDSMYGMRCYRCKQLGILDANLIYYTASEGEAAGSRFIPICSSCIATNDTISPNWTIHFNALATDPLTDLVRPIITFRALNNNTGVLEYNATP